MLPVKAKFLRIEVAHIFPFADRRCMGANSERVSQFAAGNIYPPGNLCAYYARLGRGKLAAGLVAGRRPVTMNRQIEG